MPHPFKKAWSRNLKSRVKWFFYGISKGLPVSSFFQLLFMIIVLKASCQLSHSATFTLTFLEVRGKISTSIQRPRFRLFRTVIFLLFIRKSLQVRHTLRLVHRAVHKAVELGKKLLPVLSSSATQSSSLGKRPSLKGDAATAILIPLVQQHTHLLAHHFQYNKFQVFIGDGIIDSSHAFGWGKCTHSVFITAQEFQPSGES